MTTTHCPPTFAPRARRPAAGLALLLACAFALSARAQPDEEVVTAPWVQVEVIVFRQLDTSGAGDERWPEQPRLGYPAPLHFLRTPEEDAAWLAAEAAVAAATQPAVDATAEPAAAPQPAPLEPAPAGTADPAVPAPEPPRPFVLLPEDQRTLLDAARRIAGSAQMRVLRYAAWRQPITPLGGADRFLLTGGQPVADHFELEGSLSIERTRFLHVATRLWLNDFATTDAPAATGVALPPVPQPPPLPVPPVALVPGGIDPAADPAATANSGSFDATAASADDTGAPATNGDALPAVAPEPPPPLRARRSVVLEIARRVRLGELHYVDHPLFGVLLRIQPWDPAQPALLPPEGSVPAAASAPSASVTQDVLPSPATQPAAGVAPAASLPAPTPAPAGANAGTAPLR